MAVTETTDTTSVPGKIIKKFTTDLLPGEGQDSTTWICPPGVTSIRILIVGGGGAAGNGNFAGGGGAGGVLDGTISTIPGTSYNIKVGAGGLLGANLSTPSTNGGNSQFEEFVAIGGGRGASYDSSAGNPLNGGSGGGGAPYHGSAAITIQESYGELIGYGNNGGPQTTDYNYGSGGGGAGSSGIIKDGGNGFQSDITGSNVIYACGGGSCSRINYGAPGNGGSENVNGGKGGYYYDSHPEWSYPAQSGTNGTGSGGGGGFDYLIVHNSFGASGGSGIVILQYSIPKVLIRERQSLVNGSGNLLVMEVQT